MDGIEGVTGIAFRRACRRKAGAHLLATLVLPALVLPALVLPRLVLLTLVLTILVLPASTHADYPWQQGVYLSDATALSHWNDAIDRHDQQRDQLTSCIEDQNTCESQLKGLARLMGRAAGLTKDQQLRLVNRYINGKRYKSDRPTHATSGLHPDRSVFRNSWSTPVEFTHRGGDCEDFASAKYFLLRDLGFSSDDLRIVVTYERRSHAYHAVLAYRQSPDQVWLLDSDNIIKTTPAIGARFIYAVNEHGIWDHETKG